MSGYAGGTLDDPTYQSHEYREVVQVHYNPDATDFETLIAYYAILIIKMMKVSSAIGVEPIRLPFMYKMTKSA